jgi:hypothetical protein
MFPQYRVSVTTLEKFRRYMNEVSSFDTEESLLESIKGIFKGNDKTKTGSAFHKIIEGEFTKEKGRIIADDVSFTMQQAKVALDYKKRHPLMVHEISVRKTYHSNFFPIQVSGRTDGTEGLNVHDAKTKYRSPEVQEYLDSCQWKFYLDMLDANIFYYDLFEVQGFGYVQKPGSELLLLNKEVEFIPHDPLQCIRYENMVPDIMVILNGFLDYLHNRNIVHLLKPAITEPELNF